MVSGFANPFRQVQGLKPERIDMGVDYAGSGPVFAPGPGVITVASASSGWPGGGYIEEKFSSGFPSKFWYLAENVMPTVHVGQIVDSSTVIGNMYAGSFGVETGWAAGQGQNTEAWALSQQAKGGDPGAFTTAMGVDASNFLASLGAPAGVRQGSFVSGTVPPGFFGSGGTVTTSSGGPFPGGSFDPLNWIASLFGGASNAAQKGINDLLNQIFKDTAGALKKAWSDAWKRFEPDFIRIALILFGVILVYAGIQGFLRPNAGPTQITVETSKAAVAKVRERGTSP